MVILIVLLTVVVMVVVDLVLRLTLKKIADARTRKERQRALDVGLRLEFADEATSLKRVAVAAPKARILAVDDEPVILDSFRKILVLAGFSVDTVESGQEALSLVRQRDYDFVFTDLKMPGMDGLDVTKAVKHLRPDIDCAIITGYATIETAVSGMQYGAVDYVQKPFTEDELVAFANRLLIRRQDRIARSTPLEIRPVTRSSPSLASPHTINVPGGFYITPEHTWVRIEFSGEGRIGLDDFFHKTVGSPTSIELPHDKQIVRRGHALFTVRRGDCSLIFPSPLSGRVSKVNHELEFGVHMMRLRPYEEGWVCAVEPSDLTADLARLQIGADAVDWYRARVESFRTKLAQEAARIRPVGDVHLNSDENAVAAWRTFATFLLKTESEAAGPLVGAAPGPPDAGATP